MTPGEIAAVVGEPLDHRLHAEVRHLICRRCLLLSTAGRDLSVPPRSEERWCRGTIHVVQTWGGVAPPC